MEFNLEELKTANVQQKEIASINSLLPQLSFVLLPTLPQKQTCWKRSPVEAGGDGSAAVKNSGEQAHIF